MIYKLFYYICTKEKNMKDTINEEELTIFLTDTWLDLPVQNEEKFLETLNKIGLKSLVKSFIELTYSDNERVLHHYTQIFIKP